MTLTWREHPEASVELREAVLFLEDSREGWGDRFLDAVDAAITSVVESPESWAPHRGSTSSPLVRTRSVAGFRYDIKYAVVDGKVVVIAYAHERRRPGYWAARISDK